MKGSGAFHRANAMMALITAAMQINAGDTAAQQVAMAGMPQYKSRGKGGKAPHRKGNGSAGVRRAALKASNVRRNRRAHRA